MPRPIVEIAAVVPPDLADTDLALTLYFAWSEGSGFRRKTCGSAEGNYRPARGLGVIEARREPRIGLTTPEAVAVQRALQTLPTRPRVVLLCLYSKGGRAAFNRIRAAGIEPELSPGLHLEGLRLLQAALAGRSVPVRFSAQSRMADLMA